jgi:serine/threonine protein kinase
MSKKREKFRLHKFLGSGTFAQTHLAEVLDSKLKENWGEMVVIKIPHDKEKEEVLISELIMNATLDASLQNTKSKNVVRYLGFSKYDDLFVMVMEHIEGKTLRNIIGSVDSQQAMKTEDALNIAKDVCKGLSVIHTSHIFHRDIKPENILIAKNGGVGMVMDFGVSRFLKSSDLASTTTGTIYYMATELLDSEGGSFYSDIYSLGVTMYEMVTGKLPFFGDSIGKIVDNIRSKKPIPPNKVKPEIDEKLGRIILKAMSRDVNKRYQTAAELLKAIKDYEKSIDEENVIRLLSSAWDLFHFDKIKKVENELRQLVKKYPQSPRAYQGLGEFYNRCQRYQNAIKVFKQGIEINPDYAMLYRDMALSLYAIDCKQQAIETLRNAIELGLEKTLAKHAKNILSYWEAVGKRK